ncbi:hypothetical protein PAXINDRAFT_88382 [Paxillus involutus ATCC 200175]|uniref:Ubiquinol-cytochrome c chaperone domain-containing protein n=1 Tax=Paxillus involutus ATCC 200175 TaxID=664439 RepID=A0A0C9SZM8_PAXIN|nr:hypothetical protein PAXINDRAFT_88382 [Paxillus involutus ATCC 200175]
MASRSLLANPIGAVSRYSRKSVRQSIRLVTSSAPPPTQTSALPPKTPVQEQSWLTQRVKSNPALYSLFLGVARVLGYGSPQQFANRRTLHMYNTLCANRADQEAEFWKKECALPPTFQSWFTITNLHVWLLTVRLRALPAPHGLNHIQGLIDHFFQDVEERVRTVLQPGILPPRSTSKQSFPSVFPDAKTNPRPEDASYISPARAPERLVTRHMKILKEQWSGLGMSMDLGLVRGDTEMAAAVWRNLLGGRGAKGISLPGQGGSFRRAVNLVGGLVENVEKIDVDVEEAKDDLSGVYDFEANESGRYVAYPELMQTLATHIRREALRLERLPDEVILGPRVVGREGEGVNKMVWGRVRP